MTFIIRNQAQIANKYLRYAKWKIRKLSEKYGEIIYSEIYIKNVASKKAIYDITVKLGVPGPDIIVSARSTNLKQLMSELSLRLKRQLRKSNQKRNINLSY